MRLFLLGLLFIWVNGMTAQVKGIVRDKETQEPLPYATVVSKTTNQGTLCNEHGEFSLSKLKKGSWLHFIMIGYASDSIQYVGQEMINVELSFENDGPEVVIEGESNSSAIKMLDAQTFQTITEKELCKAACCNLSESFETNASVDASFTDAITGTRQIKMLGLDGRYTQILSDNIPTMRGLSSLFGLTYIPGPWIQDINISKGVGSVINGYESITGQINIAHKSSTMKERVFVNAYAGSQGRYEFNTAIRQPVGEHWNSMLFLHGATAQKRWDMNHDSFLDNPVYTNLVARNDWSYVGEGGLRGNYSIGVTQVNTLSGQTNYNESNELLSTIWGSHLNTTRVDASAKTGYLLNDDGSTSLGSQVSFNYVDQSGRYGNRFYTGSQMEGLINLLFASTLSEKVKYTLGVSYRHDNYEESLDSLTFNRTEQVPGAFTEWVWNPGERVSVIAGLRGDYHNYYGFFATPRLHARWSITEMTSLKISAGKGYRSPNIIMDNVGFLASNRRLEIVSDGSQNPYGMPMEEATNAGVVFIHKFRLNSRDAKLSLDAYYTTFQNQIVADWETLGKISFYTLQGKSYSTNLQAEIEWSPIRRLDWRIAYRYLDAKTTYTSGLLDRPLYARHRFFTNLGYSTKEKDNGSKWTFDATARWLGTQRIPLSEAHLEHLEMSSKAPAYWIFNAQVAYFFSTKFEVYAGGENLGNFMQHHPIISAENPQSAIFDASLIYAPIFGRMGYVGLRWRIGGEKSKD
ncbi:MAG: hypothetical protein RLZZ77_366 [Bacteroidota bacterium]